VIEFFFLSQKVGSFCKGFGNEFVTVGTGKLFSVVVMSFFEGTWLVSVQRGVQSVRRRCEVLFGGTQVELALLQSFLFWSQYSFFLCLERVVIFAHILVIAVDFLGQGFYFDSHLALKFLINFVSGNEVNNRIGQSVRFVLVDILVVDDDFEEFLALLDVLFGVAQDLAEQVVWTLNGHVEVEGVEDFALHFDEGLLGD
jgi:hypothetical protein